MKEGDVVNLVKDSRGMDGWVGREEPQHEFMEEWSSFLVFNTVAEELLLAVTVTEYIPAMGEYSVK